MSGEWADLDRAAARRTRLAVLVGVLVATAFIAWVRLHRPSPAVPAAAVEQIAATGPSAPVELPATVIQSGPQPSAGVSGSTRPNRATQVGIYECERDGQRIVSDRPCAPDAEQRTLTVSQPDPRDSLAAQQRARATLMSVAPGRPAAPSASAPAAPGADDSAFAREARCVAIDRAIEQINARMRMGGYGTEEGNRLRGRWHELKNEWYELKCRKTGVE